LWAQAALASWASAWVDAKRCGFGCPVSHLFDRLRARLGLVSFARRSLHRRSRHRWLFRLGPVYIAEVSPALRRGRLVGLFQINIVVGILLAYFSNYCVARTGLGNDEWRWQLGIAAAPALLFLILLLEFLAALAGWPQRVGWTKPTAFWK